MESQPYTNETKQIIAFFQGNEEVAIAFSGGVDSAVLLLLAKQYAKRTKAYFVQSRFQPLFEREDALRTAKMLAAEIDIIPVDILSFPNIVANPENRCYYCKKAIFRSIIRAAHNDGFHVVLDGTNASDDVSDRPGFQALQELGVRSPLRRCGYKKEAIRQLAAQAQLPVADKPSYACLATRIPAGTAITEEALQTTEAAEEKMRTLGFQNFRVRTAGGDAKIELGRRDFTRFYIMRKEVYTALSEYYPHIYLDLKERTDE